MAGWQDVATGSLGAQAPAVINYLSSVNPNYDWTSAIGGGVNTLNSSFGGAWQDPSRGSSAGVAQAILGAAGQDPTMFRQDEASQNASILKTQNPPNKGLFGMGSWALPLLGIGLAAFTGGGSLGLDALGTAGVGSEAALGELGINTALDAGAVGGIAAGSTAADIAATGLGSGFLGALSNPLDSLSQWASNLFTPSPSNVVSGANTVNSLAGNAGNNSPQGGGGGIFSGGPGGVGFGTALSSLSSLGSGLYGMSLADQQRKLALQNAGQISSLSTGAAPWLTSGGMASAAQQLQQLNTDPTAAMASDPRFAAMVQAAQRANAPAGQGSGAMAVAGAKAGGDWYTQRMSELSGLAGVGNAGTAISGLTNAGQISLAGNQAGNTLAGQSLASIGFGLNTATGGGATSSMPPQVLQWLIQNGMLGGTNPSVLH